MIEAGKRNAKKSTPNLNYFVFVNLYRLFGG